MEKLVKRTGTDVVASGSVPADTGCIKVLAENLIKIHTIFRVCSNNAYAWIEHQARSKKTCRVHCWANF